METTQHTKVYILAVLSLCLLAATSVNGIVLPEEGEETNASKYTRISQGEMTASGETYDGATLSCAHPSLPFGTVIRIQNQHTGRSIDVKVNDRVEKEKGIQLSEAAAFQLDVKLGSPILVLATPVGMTTANLAPDYTYSLAQKTDSPKPKARNNQFQFDAIPVAFSANGNQESSVVPVTFINNDERNTHNSTPPEQRNTRHDPVAQHRDLLPAIPVAMRSSSFDQQWAPIRAQFGAYGDANEAYRSSHQLNSIGFETIVLKNASNVYCVVTKDTFSNGSRAAEWINQVESVHQQTLNQVRL